MKPLPFAIAIAVVATGAASFAQEIAPAFNGVDLDGWRLTAHPESWVVADGELQLTNDANKEGSILWTERDYGDVIVELEFRFGDGVVDSGVFLRNEVEQIQIGESSSLRRDMTGSPYIAGKGYPVEATAVAEQLRPGDWNAMKIVAVGGRYDVWLNGAHVMAYTSDSAGQRGPIGLQLHPGREMTIRYRNVRLAELQ